MPFETSVTSVCLIKLWANNYTADNDSTIWVCANFALVICKSSYPRAGKLQGLLLFSLQGPIRHPTLWRQNV